MKLFGTGKSYVMPSPGARVPYITRICIAANDRFAWLVSDTQSGETAYCWTQDGKSVSLSSRYDYIDLATLEATAALMGYTLTPITDAQSDAKAVA